MKKQDRYTIGDSINTLDRHGLEVLANTLAQYKPTSNDMLAVADSIWDQELREYFIKQWQKQVEASQIGSHKQAPVCPTNPPRSAQFVLLLIPKRNREHLIGDLEEEFSTIVLPQYGRFLAGCWYFEQVALAIACYAWPTIKKVLGLSVIFKLIGK